MDGRARGRASGHPWRVVVRVAALGLAAGAAGADRLAAQVGYDPGHSPYRDIVGGGAVVLAAGYLGGGRGQTGVGMSNGATGSARFELPLGHTVSVSFNLASARTSRFLIDPTKDSLTRKSGPIRTSVSLADVGLQLLLTGGKTWHRLAPFVGGSLGLALGGNPTTDASGYHFGTTFQFAPSAGVRWYPTRRLSVRTDFRLVFWKLTYPLSFKQPGPDGSRVLSVDASDTEWTKHPWISVGLGWTF